MSRSGYVAEPLAPGQLGYDPAAESHAAENPADENRGGADARAESPRTGGAHEGRGDQGPQGAPHEVAQLLATMTASARLLAQSYPLWSLPQDAIGQIVRAARELAVMADNLAAVVLGESVGRGLPTLDGLSVTDWASAQAPTLQGPAVGRAGTVAKVMNEPRWQALAGQVRSGAATVEQAAVIIRLDEDVRRFADPEQVDAISAAMTENAPLLSVRELHRLAAHARASLKPPRDIDELEKSRRMGRAFTKTGCSAGMTEYRLRLDPEGAAIVDAAIDPLARPRPDLGYDEVGKDDPRTPATRRADALLELVGRAVAAPEGVTRTPRTKVVVTLDYRVLCDLVRGAGTTDNDQVISAATVRRMACEASIIPAVLAGPSTPLDLGWHERYFTRAQRRALAIRDKGCTFPGCTIPPQWCEAHHARHWIDGGPTDLENGALLCGRHHTIVHERGMTPTICPSGVAWHY